MAQPLRYIQIGTGGWGGNWCRQFLPRLVQMGKATPAAVVDMHADNFINAIEGYGISPDRCFTDAREAFDKVDADFAIIVVPPAVHEEMVDLALAHGMDILSEKPIADTMAASARIYHKVRAAGKKMAVTMSHRFDQDKQTLQREIAGGQYGPLNYLVGRFTHNCRRYASWGEFRHNIADPLLIEGTVHHFDIFRALSQSNAKTVYAMTWNPSWGEYAGDSTGFITMEMENGVRCLYEGAKTNASTMNGWTNEYFRAECCDGTLELDRRRLRVLRSEAWSEPVSEAIPLLTQEVWCNAWLAELFIDWLNTDVAPPNTLADNIQCAALLFAAIESAHTGQPVDVQAFLQSHLTAVRASYDRSAPGGGTS